MASHRNCFGQALRPEPAMQASCPPPMAVSRQGVAPQTHGRAWPSRYGLNGQQRHPPLLLTSGEGVWGMPPCPRLMRPVPRAPCFVNAFLAAVAPYKARRVAQWHNPTRRPLRALLSRYFGGRRLPRAPAGATTMPQASPGGHAPLVGVGVRKAVGRAGPPQDGPKLGVMFARLRGLVFIGCSSSA